MAQETKVLFSVENPASYFSTTIPIVPGNSTVILRVKAIRIDADGAETPKVFSQHMQFYRKSGMITGVYKRPEVGAGEKLFEDCRSYVPEAATQLNFSWGGKPEDAAAFKVLSAELVQEFEPWPPIGATAVPDWVAADPGPTHPTITWTQDSGILMGEKPESFYPVATFMVNEKDMAQVKAAGFNLIQDYGADGSADDITLKWLDAAHSHGLKGFVAFNRGKLKSLDMAYVAERVRALRDHPALLAWYVFDEPELPAHGVSPSRLKPSYDLIKRLDPTRPVLAACYHEVMIPDYAGCYDVHLTQAYQDTAAEVEKEAIFSSGQLEGLPGKIGCIIVKNKIPFIPYAEARASAYIAMTHQSGLMWWGWWNGYFMNTFIAEKNTFDKRFDQFATKEEKLAAFQKEFGDLTHEINGVSYVFSAPGKVQRSTINNVHTYVKTTEQKTYVALVCVGENGAVELPLPGITAVKNLLGAGKAELRDGKLYAQLIGSEVLILEGTQ